MTPFFVYEKGKSENVRIQKAKGVVGMEKRKKQPLYVLLFVMVALVSAVAFACTDGKLQGTDRETPEVGEYYCVASDGTEYTLSLNKQYSFTYKAGDNTITGTYVAVNDNAFTLTFTDGTMSASLSGDVLTVAYNGQTLRFFKKVLYTVTFDVKGGSAVAAQQVMNGKTASKPADPTREGHVFVGWFADEKFTQPFSFGTQIVTGNITLYAQWVAVVPGQTEFTVQFDLGYENAPAVDGKNTIGGKLYGVETPERAGYDFKGWWVSTYEQRDKLTYKWNADTTFAENTTLFAEWEAKRTGGKLAAPEVSVENGVISWNGIVGVSSYTLEITGPSGYVPFNGTVGATSKTDAFDDAPVGDYVIKVRANATSAANNSETTVRSYRHKALSRVSLFQVVEPSSLLFNAVANAEKYLITIDCGDKEHNHTDYDNGNSTNYNFANCVMQKGGIKFTVSAVAEGYAPSVPNTFVFERVLDSVTGLSVDESTQTVNWTAVPHATDYVVTVICGDGEHKETVTGTSYDLRACTPVSGGAIVIKVQPRAKGYVSSDASEVTFEKASFATPSDVRLVNKLLTWSDVGADSYTIRIGGKEFTAETNRFDLSTIDDEIGWENEKDYVLNIRANGAVSSPWSDDVDMRYYALYSTLAYGRSTVSWRHVIGATAYRVQVNGTESATVETGVNFAEVVLTQKGKNTVSVSFYDGSKWSEEACIEVTAFEITFDSGLGTSVAPQYKALGDRMDVLPTSTRTGYHLNGWYNAPGGAENNAGRYTDETLANAEDMILYANWTPNTYTVTYNAGAQGETNQTTSSVTYLKDYTLEIPTSTDGAVAFMGWFSELDGRGTQYTDANGNGLNAWEQASDVVVFAYWVNVLKYTERPDGTYSVSKGPGIDLVTSVTIPSVYNGKLVSQVASYAFSYCYELETVNIPDTIRIVETKNAFSSCKSLKAINVYHVEGNPESVYSSEEGVLIFKNENTGACELSYVPMAKDGEFTVPASVTDLPLKIFNNASFTKIIVPTNVVSVQQSAFFECKLLEQVVFEADKAFNTPDKAGALTIYPKAFDACPELKRVDLPERLVEFTAEIFNTCKAMETINIDRNSPNYSSVDGMLCDKAGATILCCPVGKSEFTITTSINAIGDYAFKGCVNLTELVVPGWVRSIGVSAFEGCSKITEITFKGYGNSTVELTVGTRAFATCSSLEKVTFEKNSKVVDLGDYSFYLCGSVTEIVLPATVKKIGNHAFETCKALESVEIPASMTIIGDAAFQGCLKLASVRFAENGAELSLGKSVFQGCSKLNNVYIPANVVGIGDGIFMGCKSLTEVEISPDNEKFIIYDRVLYGKNADGEIATLLFFLDGDVREFKLPDTIKTLGSGLFKNNRVITSITIGTNVTTLGDEVFRGCTALQKVVFESGRKEKLEIGENVFYGCVKLAEIQLPNKLDKIPQGMFRGCTSLVSVVIPDGITEIGVEAYHGCSAIRSITFGKDVKKISDKAFLGCNSLPDVFIPNTVTEIDGAAFRECTSLRFVSFEEGDLPLQIHSSGMNAIFYKCTALESVVLPDRLTSIDTYAFNGCTSLKEITIPKGVTEIGNYAFSGCTQLQTVDYTPGSVATALSIGTDAFKGCAALKVIRLPKRLSSINYGSSYNLFEGCDAISEFDIEEGSKDFVSSEQGILYRKNKDGAVSDLLLCPRTITGTVTVPKTVSFIYSRAFMNCYGLEGVEFEKGAPNEVLPELVIEDGRGSWESAIYSLVSGAFLNCGLLTNVTLPERLTQLGAAAFGGCTSLESVVFEGSASKLSKIGGVAFCYCTSLTSVTFEATESKLTSIGDRAFAYTALNEFTMPASVTLLEGQGRVFENSIVRSVTIPSRFANNQSLFTNCDMLCEIKVHEGTTLIKDGVTFDESGTMLVKYPAGLTARKYTVPKEVVTIAQSAFQNQRYLTELDFESGSQLTTIGEKAFMSCYSLESIIIPNTLSSLGKNAFSGCARLQTVDFGNNVSLTTIEAYTFQNCNSLTTVNLPSGVTSLAAQAFQTCKGLQSIVLPNGITTLLNNTFYDCVNLRSVTLPESLTELGNLVFCNSGLTEITIPSSVTKMGKNVFQNCAKLKKVTIEGELPNVKSSDAYFKGCYAIEQIIIESGVTAIGDYAFASTGTTKNSPVGLTVEFKGNSVESIGNYAFQGSGLTEIVIPDSVKTIGTYAFQNCELLNSVTLPSGLKTMDNYLFAGCTALTGIIIPNSVESIGNYAFQGSGLTEIVIPDSVTTLGTYVFRNCTALNNVTLSSKITKLDNYLFGGCAALTQITIPNSVESIGNYAFQDSGLTEVILPEGLKTIGTNAFQNCESLAKVDLKNVTSIGANAFQGTNLSAIVIPVSVTSIGKAAFAGIPITSVLFEDYAEGYTGPRSTVTIAAGTSAITATGYGAFAFCENLTDVTLSSRVTGIPDATFLNSAITSITIPTSVTTIGKSAFAGTPITTITFDEYDENYTGTKSNVTITAGTSASSALNFGAFAACENLLTVTLSSRVKEIPNYMFYGSFADSGQTVVNLGKAVVEKIGQYAFMNTKLTRMDLKEGLLTLGFNAFRNSKLAAVTIPKSVQSFDNNVFLGNENLVTVNIPTDGLGHFGTYTFSGCIRLETVNFTGEGEQLKKIGAGAFYGTGALTKIEIPDSVTEIGSAAFYNGGLTSIVIPDNVTEIAENTFNGNAQLASVTLPSGVAKIGHHAFANCGLLTEIVLPYGLQQIEEYAFSNCGLTQVSLPENVTNVGNCVFFGCAALASASIPESVTSIGENIFEGCVLLTDLQLASGNTLFTVENGALYNRNKTELYSVLSANTGTFTVPSSVTTILPDAFARSAITRVVFEGDISEIGAYTFDGCAQLEEIVLPEGVFTIGDYAFRDCSALKKIYIPSSVTSIGEGAFDGCTLLEEAEFAEGCTLSIGTYFQNTGLKRIVIPQSVTGIDENAFTNLTTLVDIVFAENGKLASIGANAFQGIGAITSITVPSSVATIGNYAFADIPTLTTVTFAQDSALNTIGNYVFQNSQVSQITLPGQLSSLGALTFAGCENLQKVTFAESERVLTISGTSETSAAFAGFTSLTDVDFTNRATTIGNYAFFGCTALQNITWDSIVSIGDYAFAGCEKIAAVSLASGLKKVGAHAFLDTAVTELTIPGGATIGAFTGDTKIQRIIIEDGIATIASNTFKDCVNLTEVRLPSTLVGSNSDSTAGISESAFQNSGITGIEIPIGLKRIGKNAFMDCAALTTVTFAKGCRLESMGEGAFRNSGITGIELPENMTALSNYTFYGCGALLTAKLPARLTTISQYVFAECAELTSVNIPIRVSSIGAHAFENCTSVNELTLPIMRTVGANAFTGWTNAQTIKVQVLKGPFVGIDGTYWDEAWNADSTANVVWQVSETTEIAPPAESSRTSELLMVA